MSQSCFPPFSSYSCSVQFGDDDSEHVAIAWPALQSRESSILQGSAEIQNTTGKWTESVEHCLQPYSKDR